MANSISGVPPGEVGTVVQDMVNGGATEIVIEQSADGTYSISAR